MMLRIGTVAIVAVLSVLTFQFVIADPPGDQLVDQVKQAYDQTAQYQATLHFGVNQEQGRWTTTQRADFRMAYDRAGGRLLIDAPEWYVVIKDGKLLLRGAQLPGRHVETRAPSPLNYQKLIQAVPFLGQPPLVDVAFLLAEDPVAAMAGQSVPVTTLPPAEGETVPRLRFGTPQGEMTLTLDPQTKRIARAVIEPDLARPGAPAVEAMSLVFEYEDQTQDEPLGDATFSFNTVGSQMFPSIHAMVTAATGPRPPHPLEGQAATPIELQTMDGKQFKLADEPAKVVVLDFWATWCAPCRVSLPELQDLADRLKAQGKSVAVYAVNIGETPEQARRFWEELSLTMPVLMDPQLQAAGAYGMQGVPHTVIVANGKIQHIHSGALPGISDLMESQINALLQGQ